MDNIIFERIWQDNDITGFFEIKITAQSESVCATSNIYAHDDSIIDLSNKLSLFINDSDHSFLWELGEKGPRYTPSASLEFKHSDKMGHIIIDVFMEIDDGIAANHYCSFYVKTELGLLEQFAKSLKRILKPVIGEKVELNSCR